MLSLVSAPGGEPFSVDEVKLHLRVDLELEDQKVREWIAAAREYAENHTRRKLIRQVWDLKLCAFPCGPIELPFAPALSVDSVTYIDTAGASTTWSSALYETDIPAGPYAMPARLQPVYGGSYPVTRDVFNAVVVRFTCGYGSKGSDIPMLLRAAMLQLIGALYEGRTPQPNEVTTANAWLWGFRI